MKINDLTQEIGERFADLLPTEQMTMIKWRRVFVTAAFDAGWVEGDRPALLVDTTKLYAQLSVIWREANELPNG